MQDKVDTAPKRQRVFKRDAPGADLKINGIQCHSVVLFRYPETEKLFNNSKEINVEFTTDQIEDILNVMYDDGYVIESLDMSRVYTHFGVDKPDDFMRNALRDATIDEIVNFTKDNELDFSLTTRTEDLYSGDYLYIVGIKYYCASYAGLKELFKDCMRGNYEEIMIAHAINFIFIRMLYDIVSGNRNLVFNYELWITALSTKTNKKLAKFDCATFDRIPERILGFSLRYNLKTKLCGNKHEYNLIANAGLEAFIEKYV